MSFEKTDPADVSPLFLPVLALLMIALVLAAQAAQAFRSNAALAAAATAEAQALQALATVSGALAGLGDGQAHSRFAFPSGSLDSWPLPDGDSLSLRDLSALAWSAQRGSGIEAPGTYAYVHPALADETALRSVLGRRLRDRAGTEAALDLIQSWIASGADIQTWQSVLDRAGRELWPILAPLAPVNVNLADRQTLLLVCTAQWGSGALQQDFISELELAREWSGVDQAKLDSLFDRYSAPQALRAALGVRSWFWEAELRQSGKIWTALFCVIPDRDPSRPADSSSVMMLSLRREG